MPSGIQYAAEDLGPATEPAEHSTFPLAEPLTIPRASDLDEEPDTFDDETRVRGEEAQTQPRSEGEDEETRLRQGEEEDTRLRLERQNDPDCETKRNPIEHESFSSFAATRCEAPSQADIERSYNDNAFAERLASAPATQQDPAFDEPYGHEAFSGERATEPPRTYPSQPAFDRTEDSGARARPVDRGDRVPSISNVPGFGSSFQPAPNTEHLPQDRSGARNDSTADEIVARQPQARPLQAMPAHDVHRHGPVALGPTQLSAPPPQEMQRPHPMAMALGPTHLAAPPPQEMAAPVGYPHYPGFGAAGPRMLPQTTPSFSGPGGAPGPAPFYGRSAAPVAPRPPTSRAEPRTRSKVGRFAWFVFGAAFGLFFAFFATGFVSRLGKNDVPPAPEPAAMTAPAAPTVTATVIGTSTPAATVVPIAPTPPAAMATPPAHQPTATPAPPVARARTHAPPRPAPKAAQGSDSADDDGLGPSPPRKAAKEKAGDVGDLLNAGIAP